jgi:hypothetical protein
MIVAGVIVAVVAVTAEIAVAAAVVNGVAAVVIVGAGATSPRTRVHLRRRKSPSR